MVIEAESPSVEPLRGRLLAGEEKTIRAIEAKEVYIAWYDKT